MCTCVRVHSLMVNHSHFTSQKIIFPCPVGSRASRSYFVNMGCGQKQACQPSARSSSACLAMWIAAAILYLQPDFTGRKSQLEELVESHSHLCSFYPKYHCKLNFIKQYCGVAKTHYCIAPWATTAHKMEATVRKSLDNVLLPHIQRWVVMFCPISLTHFLRFANRAACLISAYKEGLLGTQAVWANKTMATMCCHLRMFLRPKIIYPLSSLIQGHLVNMLLLLVLELYHSHKQSKKQRLS